MKKKFVISGSIALAILVGGAAYNVNLNAQSDNLPDLVKANIEALANNEGGGDWLGGWDELETSTEQRLNGYPVWQRITVECAEGGPMRSCEEGCQTRYWIDNGWDDWQTC
jgi:hypothetical protein